MASIQEFIVKVPPTSEGVRDRVVEAIRLTRDLELVLLPEQDVPAPQVVSLAFPMRHINLYGSGRLDIEGKNEVYDSIVVRTQETDSEPATVSIVIP